MADPSDNSTNGESGGGLAPSPTLAIALNDAPVLWNGYRIFEEIASGGMATVHLAVAPRVSGSEPQFVAIKKMHAHFASDPDFTSMFLDEAMVCKNIRHPNVVATIDVVHDQDDLLLVLELVEGESLSKMVKGVVGRKERVPQDVVSAVVIDMLAGLHAAHEATSEDGEPLMLVHRDVSPHNVVVGTDGIAKVLDFGVAKARGRVQQTQKGQLKGKIAYMSPEQARGKTVDRRSDVFAAGVVLWELLLGRRLYEQDNEAALLVALISEAPARLSSKESSLARFDELVGRALATDPNDRFATAASMADAIREQIPPASRAEVSAWVKREARTTLQRRAGLIARARELLVSLAAAPSSAGGSGSAERGQATRPPAPSDINWDLSTTTNEDEPASRGVGLPGLAHKALPAPPPRAPLRVPRITAPRLQSSDKPAAHGAAGQPSRLARPPISEAPTALHEAGPGGVTLPTPTAGTPPVTGSLASESSAASRLAVPAFGQDPKTMDEASLDEASLDEASIEEPDPEATVPLYVPPQEYLERWRQKAAEEAAGEQAVADGRSSLPYAATELAPPSFAPAFGPPPSSSEPRMLPPGALETMRIEPDRAEGIASQVTSVTVTTTAVPPPPPLSGEQVKRLTLAAGASAGVVLFVAMSLLLVFGRQPAPSNAASGQPPTSALVLTPTASPTATSKDAAPTATATPTAPTAESTNGAASGGAASGGPPETSAAPATAQPSPRPPPAPTYQLPSPTSNFMAPPTKPSSKPSSKPRR